MMKKIKMSFTMAALVVLSLASPAEAQHNHIQSSISGQYGRLIHNDDLGAGATDQATENRKKPKPGRKVGSSAGPTTGLKNPN
jgi:hypothetical protein